MRIDRKSERHLATRKVAVYTVLMEITSDAGGSKVTEQITRRESTNVVPSVVRNFAMRWKSNRWNARYRMLPLTVLQNVSKFVAPI